MKECRKCCLLKNKEYYHQDKSRKDGLLDWCKKCKIESRQIWHKNNLDKDRISKKRYSQRHSDEILEKQRLFHVNNPDYGANKAKEYRERLGKKYNERIREQDKEKRTNDPFYAMKRRISGTLYASIVKYGFKKQSKSSKLLGCSYVEFKSHIERLFDSEMNWNNYSITWTYDHICPCNQAQNEEELIKLQHYSNLRPYKDNFKKSDSKTLEGEIKCEELLGRRWL